MTDSTRVDAIVIGSGAGGAVTAMTLAGAGMSVAVLEEGANVPRREYGKSSPEGMAQLFRRSGMTPILGRVPIGFVEGRCVGGSTDFNSGFWHRAPREVLLSWQSRFDLQGATESELVPHYEWAEQLLSVSPYPGEWPKSTKLFQRGIDAMGWAVREIPRTAPGCQSANTCASGCASGKNQGMSQGLLPEAKAAGANILSHCRVKLLLRQGRRVTGVLAEITRDNGSVELVRIDADHVFVCAGASQTPTLLRQSGLRYKVGDQLRLHPMLKLTARFPQPVNAQNSVLPLLQVNEFWPEISLGGAYFSSGHLAFLLGDNWPQLSMEMEHQNHFASYYVAVRGNGRGSVRPSALGNGDTALRYDLSVDDLRSMSRGVARLATLLLAAGAEAVYPAIRSIPVIRTELDAVRWLTELLPAKDLSLTTVHAFSSCPMGEQAGLTAANSYGRVHHVDNLYVNDASMLPDSPGVNPQGTVMALARRNALHFVDSL